MQRPSVLAVARMCSLCRRLRIFLLSATTSVSAVLFVVVAAIVAAVVVAVVVVVVVAVVVAAAVVAAADVAVAARAGFAAFAVDAFCALEAGLVGALPLTVLCLNLIRCFLRPFVRVAVAVLARPIAGKRDVLGLRRHHRIRDVARGRNRGDVERKRDGQ